jgi:hypothetical protein
MTLELIFLEIKIEDIDVDCMLKYLNLIKQLLKR